MQWRKIPGQTAEQNLEAARDAGADQLLARGIVVRLKRRGRANGDCWAEAVQAAFRELVRLEVPISVIREYAVKEVLQRNGPLPADCVEVVDNSISTMEDVRRPYYAGILGNGSDK